MEPASSEPVTPAPARTPTERAGELLRRGVGAGQEGRLDEAEVLLERGLGVAREFGLELFEPEFLSNLGILEVERGETGRGLELLLEARGLYARVGNRDSEGQLLIYLGGFYRTVGAYPEAISALTEGIEHMEALGKTPMAAAGLGNLAMVYAVAGLSERAVRCAEDGLRRLGGDHESYEASFLLGAYAYAHREAGDLESARDAAVRALAIVRGLGRDIDVAESLILLGSIHLLAEQIDLAEARFGEGLAIADRVALLRLELGCKLGLAQVQEERGDCAEALALVEPLIDRWEELGEPHTLLDLYALLGRLAEAVGDTAAALQYLKRASALRQEIFNRETDVRLRHIQVAQDLRRERERSAEVLQQLSQQVLESQEEERRRLALELHDDLGQRLALLAVELDMLAGAPPDDAEDVGVRAAGLSDLARGIADDVSSIAHRLHPAVLAQLGLVEATRSLCGEMSDAYDCEVSFHATDVPTHLPNDIALCLYRIVQEGLRNAVRHGGARRGAVRLACEADAIRLQLSDEGSGFDPKALRRPGLGLAGMCERVRHLGGRFRLQSEVGEGTRVDVTLPLPEEGPEA